MIDREENRVFEEWRASQQQDTLDRLAELLLKHATAVTFLVFRAKREDVAQEAVVKGLEGLKGFRDESLFSTWFHSVALNHARDRLRQEILAEARTVELQENMARIGPEVDSCIELAQLSEGLDSSDQEFIRDKLEGRVESELSVKYGLTPEGIRSRWNSIKNRIRRRAE